MKSKSVDQVPPRPGVTCPRCHQLLKLKKPSRGFWCIKGHEFPVEVLLVLKARRLESLLREPLPSLEKLAAKLDGAAADRAEEVRSVYVQHAAAAAREAERLRRTIDDDVFMQALPASAAADKARTRGRRRASEIARENRLLPCPRPSCFDEK